MQFWVLPHRVIVVTLLLSLGVTLFDWSNPWECLLRNYPLPFCIMVLPTLSFHMIEFCQLQESGLKRYHSFNENCNKVERTIQFSSQLYRLNIIKQRGWCDSKFSIKQRQRIISHTCTRHYKHLLFKTIFNI